MILAVTSSGSIHLDPLGLGLGNQTIAVLGLDLLGTVVLQGGQGVVVDVTISKTSNESRPTSDLQGGARTEQVLVSTPWSIFQSVYNTLHDERREALPSPLPDFHRHREPVLPKTIA